jgi:LPS export ABC transporter protein LptC
VPKKLIKNIITFSVKSIIVIFFAIMLFACENSMKTINSISNSDTLPAESARDIEVIYSDSGKTLIKLIAPKLDRYQKKDEPYMEFPEGLKLLFYDSAMKVKTQLTANYGISWENKKLMEVKNNVVITDFEKTETLNTEQIIWNQKTRKIYSEVFVKRTTPDGVLYGDGFDADESLKTYKLRNPRGVFTVEDDVDK